MSVLRIVNVTSLVGLTITFLALFACWEARLALASRRWPTAPGRLLFAGLSQAVGIPVMYSPSVRYQYTVGGVPYESTRLRFGALNTFSYSMTMSALHTATGTGTITVFYDPHRPTRCCLLPGTNEWTLVTPVLLLIFGTGLLALGLWAGLRM
jgi:Protein of unknown function (DUF3592)